MEKSDEELKDELFCEFVKEAKIKRTDLLGYSDKLEKYIDWLEAKIVCYRVTFNKEF